MTVPFYTQEELDAAIRKERLWIAAFVLGRARGDTVVAALQAESIAHQIAKGDYPRPLVVEPLPETKP
jgi:hypothetical protein